ncbi:T9SS type A sorting domain-containing protein [bacterium]|nr:T9SS type A sorting domain-containing protein [bacterium]
MPKKAPRSEAVSISVGENTYSGIINEEQWYQFTATRNGKIEISSCGNTTDGTQVLVYSECDAAPIALNNVACSAQSKAFFEGIIGMVYYIKWKNTSSSDGFTWDLTESDWTEGEDCSNPSTAVVGENTLSLTENSYYWYTFTATRNGKITISSCSNTTDDTHVYIYSICGNSNIANNNDYCDSQSQVSFEGIKGETYYIKWKNYSSTTGFVWNLSETDWAQGEICSDPLPALAGDNTHTEGNNTYQWFSYTATQTGKITVSSCNETTNDTHVFVYSECDGSAIASNNDYCDSQSQVSFNGIIGETYYIKWKHYNSSTGFTWTLSETNWALGELCSNPIAAISGDNTHTEGADTYQWYNYTATRNGKITVSSCDKTTDDTKVVVYSECNGSDIDYNDDYCATQSQVSFVGIIGETYLIKWKHNNSSTGFTWTLSETDWSQGEICSTPISAITGDNTHTEGTNTYQWHSFTATKTGKIVITNCGQTADDTQVSIFNECEGELLAQNDDYCGTQSQISFESTSGNTYYIRWINYSSNNNFTWTLHEVVWDQGELCSNPLAAIAGDNTHTEGENTYQWHSFTATKNGKIKLSSAGQTNDDTEVLIYSACNADPFAYNDDYINTQSQISFDGTLGEIYYIKWINYSTDKGFTWTLIEDDWSQGELCSNPIAATLGENAQTEGINTYQWYSFTATQNGKIVLSSCNKTSDNTKVLVYTDCDGASIASNDDYCNRQSQVSFEGTLGVTYYIKWKSYSSSDGFIWTLSEMEWSLGEICSNPKTAIMGDINFANHSTGIDQWYSYTSPINGEITISSCDLNTEDTEVNIFIACGEELSFESSDDYCDKQSEVIFNGTIGTTYYIQWTNAYTTGTYFWSLFQPGISTNIKDCFENKSHIHMYPNPARSEFKVISDLAIKTIKVINTAGNIVYKSSDSGITIPIIFKSGLYIVEITLKNNTIERQKLVVQ